MGKTETKSGFCVSKTCVLYASPDSLQAASAHFQCLAMISRKNLHSFCNASLAVLTVFSTCHILFSLSRCKGAWCYSLWLVGKIKILISDFSLNFLCKCLRRQIVNLKKRKGKLYSMFLFI